MAAVNALPPTRHGLLADAFLSPGVRHHAAFLSRAGAPRYFLRGREQAAGG